MLDFFLCTFLTILFSVMLLFYYTVVHAQDTVRRRNQANELTEAKSKVRSLENELVRRRRNQADELSEAQSKVRNLESELVKKNKKLDELRKELLRTDNKSRKALEISLAASGSPDIPDYASSPSSPEIMVTDTGSMYDESPYPEETIKNNQEEVAAAMSQHVSSRPRHSSNASVAAFLRFMFSGRGSKQEAMSAVKREVGSDEDDLWESENSTWNNEELITATTRRHSSSRRGSYSADQMSLMSVDTELVTLMPPEAGHTGETRRVSWPRVSATRRRHSTFPPENLNRIIEN